MSVPVTPLLRVVANGRSKEGRTRLTLIATPCTAKGGAGPGTIDLADWPAAMARRMRDWGWPLQDANGPVWVRRLDTNSIGDWSPHAARPARAAAYEDEERWETISGLWKKALARDDDKQWAALADDIGQSLRGKSRSAELSDKYAGSTSVNPDDGAIIVEDAAGGNGETVAIKGVVSIPQSDLAIEEEAVRAARMLRVMSCGPFALNDEDDDLDALKSTTYEEMFAAATASGNGERGRTTAEKAETAALLQNGTRNAAGVCGNGAATVPSPADVLGQSSSGRNARRENYRYANWLQRPARIPKDEEERRQKMPAADAVRAAYFAIQGDPTLSRLFGLAFDIEVDGLPSGKMHLTAEDPGRTDVEMIVATAALLEGNSFWPVSIFEAFMAPDPAGGVRMLDVPDLVEQRHGIWRLGTDVEVEVDGSACKRPRHLPVTLQLRQAIDGKGRDRDRGEQHNTAGFAILDRDRAGQIARDLAIAELQSAAIAAAKPGAPPIVVLHAEELTVGRCIDVAASGPGAELSSLTWRSLTRRLVDFDFRNSDRLAESVLADLFPGRDRTPIAEEVGFQIASRMMPLGAANQFEVIADEAIYQWDGTPGGVLTDGRSDGRSGASRFPFGRRLGLPNRQMMPLRFGIGYQFRIRSKFLGGGIPECDSVETASTTKDDSVVPAAAAGKTRPRRFLRHEGIAPPVMMLPVHLAAERMRNMGFEQVDTAVVRSANMASPAKLLAEANPGKDAVRGHYEPVTERALPETTMRVFVAPEIAQDIVVRHRKFDTAKALKVRSGGLRDVSYAPVDLSSGAVGIDQPRGSGFPVVVTHQRDTLDAEGAIYECKVSAADATHLRGVPVFEPGGRNRTGAEQIGYLPDPAIHHFSVRARIPGSDRYLAGSIAVPLYPETGDVYPHALPLVVKLVRRQELPWTHANHPRTIADIAKPAVTGWLNANGVFSTSRKSGARVQLVEVMLGTSEEFHLEVTCLPTAETLATCFAVTETIAAQLRDGSGNANAMDRLTSLCGDGIGKACQAYPPQSAVGLDGQLVPDLDSLKRVAGEVLDVIESKWPVRDLAAVASLRVMHALNKPHGPAEWAPGALPTAHRIDASDIRFDTVLKHDLGAEKDGARGLVLSGKVTLDLDGIDSVQVVATTVATAGQALDDPQQGRSALSKRSGRWPLRLLADGSQRYVGVKDLVGFDVATDGRVTLPRQSVTLLSVGNLPAHGGLGALLKCSIDSETVPPAIACKPVTDADGIAPIFAPTRGRETTIELGPLFAAVGAGAPIRHLVGGEPGTQDVAGRYRELKLEQPTKIADTRARRLDLTLVSVSRHATAFETEPTYLNGEEQALLRRQPLRRQDQAVLSTRPVEVWMNSTARPSMPDLRRPELSFRFTRRRIGHQQELKRRALVRIYMGRGWFSSGEGERLGVVLWPPNFGDQGDTMLLDNRVVLEGRDDELLLADFNDADLGNGGAYVTRWGGDPIRKDAFEQDSHFIPKSAFAELRKDEASNGPAKDNPHRPYLVDRALVPVPLPRAPGQASDANSPSRDPEAYEYLQASLLTYEPLFDLDREEWYVDVDLTPNRSSEPFVRFGLVRYQPHSIRENLKVSEPVTTTIQILPDRTATVGAAVDKATGAHDITVAVEGFASLDIKSLDPKAFPGDDASRKRWALRYEELRRPKVRLALFHEATGPGGVMSRTPLGLAREDGETEWRVIGDAISEQSEFPELDWFQLAGKETRWCLTCTLPQQTAAALGAGQLVAYLEEYDKRMPASYRSEPVEPEVMFTQFESSGPRFSARMPFLPLRSEEAEASR